MTERESKIARFLVKHHHEIEDSYPYRDYRLYGSGDEMCGVISSQGEMTDILFFIYTFNTENENCYVQLFISSPDDDYQEFVYLSSLPEDEQVMVMDLLARQAENEFHETLV